ncbi:MAG TPA: YceI family protein [Thermoanaerobaculia bacterium]|jgi:polyisoprenoid-binding protein YceI
MRNIARFTLALTLLVAGVAQAANTKLPVVADKSSIGFHGEKIVGSHDGNFGKFDGAVTVDGQTPVGVEFTIDLSSVKTDSGRLDGHLKSADFFDVANHPTASFKSTKIKALGNGDYDVDGLFTLRGATNPVSFRAKSEQTADGVRVTSNFTIDRQKWGVAYKGAPDNLVKDDVQIKLDLTFPAPAK